MVRTSLCCLATGVVVSCAGLVYVTRHILGRKLAATYHNSLSHIIEIGRIPPRLNNHYLRSEFRESTIPRIRAQEDHTHPISAAWRSTAVVVARTLCAKIGMEPFVLQASPSDVRDNVAYSRDYRWMKDVCVPTSSSTTNSNSLLVIVDVDYYIDMPNILLENDNPVLLYTFQPRAAALESGEFSFRFNAANQVDYSVSGGAHYQHTVWDYSKDVITVSNVYKTRSYVMERRQANEHHEYVLFIPLGTWRFGYSWLARCLQSDGLDTLRVNQGDFNVLDVKTKDGITRSIARLGHYNCANLPLAKFNALESVNRTSKLAIGNASVQSWLDNDKLSSAVVVEYLRSIRTAQVPLVYPANDGIRTYQILQNVSDVDDAKPLMVSFMSPILPNCFVPMNTKSNEVAAVEGRILIPKAEAEALAEKPMSKFMLEEFNRFTEFLIPHPNLSAPVTIEDVYERQNRPTQRAAFAQAEIAEPSRIADTFLKAEPYLKVSDPRIITTYNTVDKREYSRYIYALASHISKTPWYSFGKTPLQIAEAVTEICGTAVVNVNCADATRMDGHVHSTVRQLERMILLRFFQAEYAPDIIDLHNAQCHLKAYTKHGVIYSLDDARGSGSAETAIFNTILSKFIDYLSRRLSGQQPNVAYFALGQFGGDDSISADLDGSNLIRAGAMLGQVIENVVFNRGSSGVNYLSRYFTTDVWFGDPSSTCDLGRILAKLHVTVALSYQITPLMKLHQKLSGLSLTDRHTPIIHQIIIAAERVGMKFPTQATPILGSWWTKFDLDVNWPNEPINDQDNWFELFIPDADVDNLIGYLENIRTADELLTMPAIKTIDMLPAIHKAMVSVDDNILVVPKPTPSQPPNKQQQQQHQRHSMPTTRCKAFALGKCTFGTKCKYAHFVCNDFLQGKCTRKVCKFAHVN